MHARLKVTIKGYIAALQGELLKGLICDLVKYLAEVGWVELEQIQVWFYLSDRYKNRGYRLLSECNNGRDKARWKQVTTERKTCVQLDCSWVMFWVCLIWSLAVKSSVCHQSSYEC